jgi:hypothetical protein
MRVPALTAEISQVAVPPLRVVVEVVQEVRPAVPLTDHVTVPVGVVPPDGPERVAVKMMLLPERVGVELVTTSDGVALETVTVSLLLVVAR